MSIAPPERKPVSIFDWDLPNPVANEILTAAEVACDIETSGLQWISSKIALCQFYISGRTPILVKIGSGRPRNICSVIESRAVVKVFHHATFDLSFMSHEWNVVASNVWCTKIAAKILNPGADGRVYSLQSLAQNELGIAIDKSQRLSNWGASRYDSAQIAYAAGDVEHLLELKRQLSSKLESEAKLEFALRVFGHIPTRVLLEIGGYGDVYAY